MMIPNSNMSFSSWSIWSLYSIGTHWWLCCLSGTFASAKIGYSLSMYWIALNEWEYSHFRHLTSLINMVLEDMNLEEFAVLFLVLEDLSLLFTMWLLVLLGAVGVLCWMVLEDIFLDENWDGLASSSFSSFTWPWAVAGLGSRFFLWPDEVVLWEGRCLSFSVDLCVLCLYC